MLRFEEALEGWQRGRMSQSEAALLLGVCDRRFRRQLVRYEAAGLEGLIDKRISQRSHRRAPVDEVVRIVQLYRRDDKGWKRAEQARYPEHWRGTDFCYAIITLHNIHYAYLNQVSRASVGRDLKGQYGKRQPLLQHDVTMLILACDADQGIAIIDSIRKEVQAAVYCACHEAKRGARAGAAGMRQSHRLSDDLDPIPQAATNACRVVEGPPKDVVANKHLGVSMPTRYRRVPALAHVQRALLGCDATSAPFPLIRLQCPARAICA